MKWLAKAVLQKLLSAMPAGEKLNYHLQRRVTRTLPRDRLAMLDRFRTALGNYQAAGDYGRPGAAPASAYEFGAGWELGLALCLYMLGVQRQVVVDLRPLLNLELLNDAMAKLSGLAALMAPHGSARLRPLPSQALASRRDLERRLGITYLAPCDARATGLPGGSFDLISSCQVMEHIPPQDIVPILSECRRLLSPTGVLVLEVDMHDHFHYFDASIGPYNFLRFTPGAWRLINSGMHYQNRLRLPDYLGALEESGLVVARRAVTWPSAQDLQQLRALPLAARFAGGRYRPYELAARSLRLVCRPAAP